MNTLLDWTINVSDYQSYSHRKTSFHHI